MMEFPSEKFVNKRNKKNWNHRCLRLISSTDLDYIDSASAGNAEKIRRKCYPGKTNLLRTACVVILKANLNVKTNSKNY